jgi:flavin-binding protein dodecin
MAAQAEHAKAPSVVRVIELVGVSSKSWSDAAQQAVTRASETIRHITGLDVVHSTAVVRDGKIMEYHVNVKIAFVVEPGASVSS